MTCVHIFLFYLRPEIFDSAACSGCCYSKEIFRDQNPVNILTSSSVYNDPVYPSLVAPYVCELIYRIQIYI